MENTTSTKRDSRVEAALAHWALRFIANGVPVADFEEVTAGLARWEDCYAANLTLRGSASKITCPLFANAHSQPTGWGSSSATRQADQAQGGRR